MKTETVTIRISEDLKRQIVEACDLTDQPIAFFVERAIKQRLARLCPRCGSEAGAQCSCLYQNVTASAIRPHPVAPRVDAAPRNGTHKKTSAG